MAEEDVWQESLSAIYVRLQTIVPPSSKVELKRQDMAFLIFLIIFLISFKIILDPSILSTHSTQLSTLGCKKEIV